MDSTSIIAMAALVLAIIALVMKKRGPSGAKGDLGDKGDKGDEGDVGPSGGSFAPSYAGFYSTQTQYMGARTTNADVHTPTPIYHNQVALQTSDIRCSTTLNNGTGSVTGDSRIFIYTAGVYKISFSIQLDNDNNSNQNAKVEFWLRKNGIDVPWSGSVVDILGKDSETFPMVEFVDSVSSGDRFEALWFSTLNEVHLVAFPAGNSNPSTTVAVPSIITNIYRIG